MAVLVTGIDSALGEAVHSHLLAQQPAGLEVRTTAATTFLPDGSTAALVHGVDVLVHLTHSCRSSSGPTDTEWLDHVSGIPTTAGWWVVGALPVAFRLT
jgi:hypothetical protein